MNISKRIAHCNSTRVLHLVHTCMVGSLTVLVKFALRSTRTDVENFRYKLLIILLNGFDTFFNESFKGHLIQYNWAINIQRWLPRRARWTEEYLQAREEEFYERQ